MVECETSTDVPSECEDLPELTNDNISLDKSIEDLDEEAKVNRWFDEKAKPCCNTLCNKIFEKDLVLEHR